MKVFDDAKFSVYVYSDEFTQSHHHPHCHIRWPDGDTVILLPTLTHLAGPHIPKGWKTRIASHIDEICSAWNKLNPEKTINEQ